MRKRHTAFLKAQIVQEVLKEEKTIAQIASECEVHPNQISQWKAIAVKGLPTLFEKDNAAQSAEKAAQEQKMQELYAEIGKLSTHVAWLKKKCGLDPEQR